MTETRIYRTERGRRRVEESYRRLLEDWPVPAERRVIPTEEGETFVLSSGPADAPPLVLLHGSGANAAMWRDDVVAFARHFRVHAVDIVGEPGCSAPARPELGAEACANWFDEVLDGLDVGLTAVVGASLGAWLATDYALRRPARVRRVVCLSPAGIGRQKWAWLLPALALRIFGRRGRRRSVEHAAGLDAERAGPYLDHLVTVFGTFKPRLKPLPVFTAAELSGLRMPVLAIAGEEDVMFDTAETVRRLRESVPQAAVRVLPGVGHSVTARAEDVVSFLRA